MSNFNNTKSINSIWIYLVATLAVVVYFLISLHNTVYWFDESYTAALIRYSYLDIWEITGTDVHPPLYYFMLKVFVSIFGTTVLSIRIFSMLGVVLIFIFGATLVKRKFGENVSFLFVLLFSLLPVTQYLATDGRMYSWAAFFVIAATLFAHSVYTKPSVKNYAAFLFFSLAAAYTHYYALAAIVVIFGLLGFFSFLAKRSIKLLFIVFVLFIGGFSFWFPYLINQVTAVNTNFWITGLTPKDLLLFTYYTFSPKDPSHPYTVFTLPMMAFALSAMLLLLAVVLGYTIKLCRKPSNTNNIKIALAFCGVCILPVVSAIIYSYVKTPIIIPRYTSVVIAPMVLGLAIIFCEILKTGKWGRVLVNSIVILLMILSVARFFSERKYIDKRIEEHEEVLTFLEKHKSGKAAFISSFNSCGTLGMFEIDFPDNLFIVYSQQPIPVSYKPFILMKTNKLPLDFDFFYIKNNYDSLNIEDRHFFRSIANDVNTIDSLVQEERSIYRMKTIHRDQKMTMSNK